VGTPAPSVDVKNVGQRWECCHGTIGRCFKENPSVLSVTRPSWGSDLREGASIGLLSSLG
jgi:hypothetical protein